jgi:phospholipase C
VRFVEDNWLGGRRMGNGDADATAGSLDGMFDFSHPGAPALFLNPSTGRHARGRQD